MGMGGTIDLLLLASGVYLIWIAIKAKRQGDIVANVMLGKGINEGQVKDKEGFIDYMYKRIILAGALIVMGSMVYLVNDFFIFSGALTWVGIVFIFSALAIYTRAYMSGQKRYIGDIQRSKRRKK